MRKLLGLSIMFLLITASAKAEWKSGGVYEIAPDIIGAGGVEYQVNGTTTNDCSFSLFAGTGAAAGGANPEIYSGFLPGINYAPYASLLTAPLNGLVTDYQNVNFAWNYVDVEGNPQMGFEVQLSTDIFFNVLKVTSGQINSANSNWSVNNCSEGSYYWRVLVKDDPWGEWGVWSSTFAVTIDTSAPDNVAIDSVVIDQSSATVSVSVNDLSTVAFRIAYSTSTNYEAAVSTTSGWFAGTVAASTTTLVLQKNTTYYYKVQAKDSFNRIGSWSQSYQYSTLCSAPNNLAWGAATDNNITVRWDTDSSGNPGGTTYIVDLSTAGSITGTLFSVTSSRDANSALVTGLSPNTTYYGRVTAKSGVSQAATTITGTRTTLCTPANASWSTIAYNSIRVTWSDSVPSTPAQTPYKVQIATSVDFVIITASSQTIRSGGGATVTGLTPNTSYYARVLNTNWENIVSTFTLSGYKMTLPNQPANTAWGSVTNTTAQVTWTDSAPSNPAYTKYTVQASSTSNFTTLVSSSDTIRACNGVILSGLNPNTTYYARVIAANMENTPSTSTINVGKPTLVTPPVNANWGIVAHNTIQVTWTDSTPSNPAQTRYTVQMATAPNFATISASSQTVRAANSAIVSSLLPATTYYARVIASNWEIISSTLDVAGTRVTTLNAPASLVWGNIGVSSMAVTWADSNPPNPVDSTYTLYLATASDFTGTLRSSQTVNSNHNAVVTSLPVNTTWYARVIVTHWSASPSTSTIAGSKATLCANPSAPVVAISDWDPVNLYNLKVTINANGNPPQTEYKIHHATLGDVKTWSRYNDGDTVTIANLDPNTLYAFDIQARNHDGTLTAFSATGSSTTAPSAMTNLQVVRGTATLAYSWATVAEAASYTIYSDTDGVIGVKTGAASTSWLKTGLIPATSFGIKINAVNQYGKGPYIVFSTYTFAEIPANMYITDVASTSMVAVFDPGANAPETAYLVKAIKRNNTYYVQADGTTGDGEVWQTWAQWGGSSGVQLLGLDTTTKYILSVCARNGNGDRTIYSNTALAFTTSQTPEVSILEASTDTVKIFVSPNGNSADSIYAIRVVSNGQTKYVQTNGTVGAGEVWAGTGTWGGQSGFTVKVSTPANTAYRFELGSKDFAGDWVSNFISKVTVYTSAVTPVVSQVAVTSSTIGVAINTVINSSSTVYAVKVVPVSGGVTYYVQADYTLGASLTYRTTQQWQLVLISSLTPNMGYSISACARNGSAVDTAYSNIVSTWTDLSVPFAPTIVGSYDDAYENYMRVTINSANSPYTKYLIYSYYGANNVQGDGSIGALQTLKTKAEWENPGTKVLIHCAANTSFSFAVKAYSEQRDQWSAFSADGAGFTPPGAPQFAPTITEMPNHDTIKVDWLWNVAGSSHMAVYTTTTPGDPASYALVGAYDYPVSSCEHDVDGSAPSAPSGSSFTPSSATLAINWLPVANPDPSVARYYKYSAINQYGAEGQKSPVTDSISVHPLISKYHIYCDTYTVLVSTYNLEYTMQGLMPNATYGYSIAAVSTDGLESLPSVHFSTYTMAATVINVVTNTEWSEANQYYNSIDFDANGNPDSTRYAISVTAPIMAGTQWLANDGTAVNAPQLIATRAWIHANLIGNTTYVYSIYSFNESGQESGPVVVEQGTQRLDRPILSAVTCTALATGRHVPRGNLTSSISSRFDWTVLAASNTVIGYSITWSTSSTDSPDNTITMPASHAAGDKASYTVTINKAMPLKVYYFKVKAIDSLYQVSDIASFTYRFKYDTTPPTAVTVDIAGTVRYKEVCYGIALRPSFMINFSKAIDTTTLTIDNIYVISANDHRESAVITKYAPQLEYNTTNYSLTITVDLSDSWTYDLVISTEVRDTVDNPLERECRMRFRTIMKASSSNEYVFKKAKGPGMTALLTLPNGSVKEDSYIIVNETPIETPLKVQQSAINDAEAKFTRNYTQLWHVEIDRYMPDGQLDVNELGVPASLTMTYIDNNNDGIVDGTTIRAESLCLWHLDEERRVWMKLPSIVDKIAKTVKAQTKHFSMFMLAGSINLSVADVRCYPVPWVPNGTKVMTGNMTDGITFDNLPQEGEIAIYTITGNLVKNIKFAGSITGAEKWFGKNEDGIDVASGVYLWIVKSSDSKKTGKLMVIR